MDHFTLNLRPKEYFQLAPNMRTAYIELCIYLISKSVTYRPGRLRTLADRNQPTRFPRPRAKYYIHLVVGQWSKGLPYGSPLCILAYHTYHTRHQKYVQALHISSCISTFLLGLLYTSYKYMYSYSIYEWTVVDDAQLITYSPTYLLTYLIAYLLTYSPTHLLTYALTYLLTYLLMLSVVRFKRVGGSASAHQ